MSKKNILVVCPDSIYPVKMGAQVRMFNMIKSLHQNHNVDVVARVPAKEYYTSDYAKEIDKVCNEYFPILAPNQKNFLSKIYRKIICDIAGFNLIPAQLYYNSIPALIKQIGEIANSKKYDIIFTFYWYTNSFYNELSYKPYFVLDTININFKKYKADLKSKGKLEENSKRLKKYENLELKYTNLSDAIISVSESDYQFFKDNFPQKKHLKIPIGQDLSGYFNYKSNNVIDKTILFYGSMRSNQNVKAFFRFYNYILPKIRLKIPEVKLIVLGADPPKKIKELHNGKDVFITGYVKDIREWIAKTSLMILPLELGGGFRTRIVEVMAMGIPVIGTHNALDSIEMSNAVHGYISDKDQEMADYAIKLIKDTQLRKIISEECKNFVIKKYSIESTYGRLSEYFLKI